MNWRGLTLLQPHGWAIGYAGKRIENRTRPFSHRGGFLLHAGVGTTRRYYAAAAAWMGERGLVRSASGPYRNDRSLPTIPRLEDLDRGGFFAYAEIVGVIPPHTHPAEIERAWHVDPRWHIPDQYGHVLEHVALLPFEPARGMLGLFPVGAEHVKALSLPDFASRPPHA